MHLEISNKMDGIQQLCKNHKVDELYLFGSYATGQIHENSDVDFLVKFGNIELLSYFDNYIDLKIQLEKLLGKSVDLVENKTIKNPFLRESIEQSRQLIYG
ncbi:MAG: nucleotidyltransferase domain-containing protein [Bacteroidetes bacterium]|nr:nucleotidyltransferase domain-containing protein [Bacteroidota bacterium]